MIRRAAELDAAERAYAADAENRRRPMLVASIAKDVGPRFGPEQTTLDGFEVYHQAQQPVLAKLRSLDLPAMAKSGQGLILYGPCGTGKDHLAIALLYLAASRHGLSGRWLSVQDWFGTLRDRMETGGAEEELLKKLTEPHVLVLSDPVPPRRELSPFNVEMLTRLIDRRYRQLKSTWATLNVASAEEADGKLGSPAFDRLRHGAVLVRCFWPSYRERQAQGGRP